MEFSLGPGSSISKRIALFEFALPDNSTTTTRLRRQDAIQRRNSNQSFSDSSISSDSEVQLDEVVTESSSEASECYGNRQVVSTIKENSSSDSSSNTSGIYHSSSDDYEAMATSGKEGEENGKYSKQKLVSTKRNRLKKDCGKSLLHPFIPRHLQLVDMSEIRLDAELRAEEEAILKEFPGCSEEENFYEELDNYNRNQSRILRENDTDVQESVEESIVQVNNAEEVDETQNETLDESDQQRDDTGRGIVNDEDDSPDYSTSPPSARENESMYSEPNYYTGSNGKLGINTSHTSSHSLSYNLSTEIPSTVQPANNTPDTSTMQNNNNYNYNSKSQFSLNSIQDSWYDIAFPSSQLPPTPTASASLSSATTKISTIAKSAGRKLSKKLNYLRRLSKSSFEGFSGNTISNGNGSNSEFYSTLSLNQNVYQNYETRGSNKIHPTTAVEFNPNGKEVLVKKRSASTSISRPSIPPPEPPRSVQPPSTSTSSSSVPFHNVNDDDMDDDDSDFYDSDSELIRNFVAAVQPIYSMEEEPLYQYYTYGISLQPEVNNYQPVIPKNLGLTLDMLVPRTGQRTLWCELPEVISSGILTILSEQQKKLQEAIFEILTSEVSYLKSLDVLVQLFFENDTLIQVLTPEDRTTLFGNITYVKDCAQSFLSQLLTKWEESWYIQDVGQVINENANHRFHVYKEYCRNKPYQDKILKRLRSTNDEFVNIIKTIEEDPKCQLLGMDSFLMLPMQRITRLPLLVNAIIQRTQSPKEKSHCEEALKSLTNLVLECNEAAKESQDAEETAAIFGNLEFKTGKSIPYAGQFLLKGDFMKNPFDSGRGQKINWTFQKNKKTFYWLILFTNQLFITKKKSSGKFEVIEMFSPLESHIKPLPNLEGISKDFQHYFMLHFDRNESVYFLAARTQSEVERWKQNFEQLKAKKDLRVQAIYLYDAKLKDELSFAVGDVILVSQTQPDGWYYGTNTRTEELGWFPGNYCLESF